MSFTFTPSDSYRSSPYRSGPAAADNVAEDNGTAWQGGNQQPSNLNSLMDFLGRPGGQALTNFAGAGLQAYGQYQQNQQNLKQNASQFAASTLQNQFNQDRALATQRATGVLNADPLGADQSFAQKNALMAAILPQLRNAHSTPGDPAVAAAMGSRQGGVSNLLPQGGLDPAMVSAMFGPNATMASIAQRHKELTNLDPNAPQPDMGSMFGPESAPYMNQIQDWAQKAQSMDASQRTQFEQQLNGYINQMAQQEQGSGFWHKFAKIAGVIGAVGATIMTAGGASPLLVGAVGAASGAAGSWGGGGNPLMGAIMGGASGYGGAKMHAPTGNAQVMQ